MDINSDVLIVGTGAAALYCSLNLRKDLDVVMLCKSSITESNSYLAQGGIATALNDNDIKPFMEDTLTAGNNKNDLSAVKILCSESREVISSLIDLDVPFNRDSSTGNILYTREGAHRINRIVYCEDSTGKSVVETLLQHVKKRKNITIYDYTTVIDLLCKNDNCTGIVAFNQSGKQINFYAKTVILACGGIGGLFKNSTNQRTITGDGLFMALKHNIKLKDIQYIQFHPTALYEENPQSRRFLISESVRGEGGKLYNVKGKRFVNELLPRDVVAKAINEQISKYKCPYVFLDVSFLNKDFLLKRFPLINSECKKRGIDITKDMIPVSPAQHYFMGGIDVDKCSKTSMNNLYAVGEASCTGVHGSNRLASNSLLEGLVFSKRAAGDINNKIDNINIDTSNSAVISETLPQLSVKQQNLVIKELEKRCDFLNDEFFISRPSSPRCSERRYSMV
ncbi:L-aspartate oxidase [Clostridium oryzae]|nr:L-aspartate oxidase [Clostridium oryzae]